MPRLSKQKRMERILHNMRYHIAELRKLMEDEQTRKMLALDHLELKLCGELLGRNPQSDPFEINQRLLKRVANPIT